ncbi:MAG: ABC transporter ATP-binding protein [Rhodospirillales bacterium]|jgi:branched-chain amino acid transport system ATP-binding protein
MTTNLLSVKEAVMGPSASPWLGPLTLEVGGGEIVALLGPNGAGKSSLLRGIMGLIPFSGGQVCWERKPVLIDKPSKMAKLGVGYVPEGRRVFPGLSAEENLLSVFDGPRAAAKARVQEMWSLFPELSARRRSEAWRLSGGEQQMLAIGRALMRQPKLVMLDEPSLGLAPMAVGRTFQAIEKLKARGIAILLSEQNTHHALEIADRVIIIRSGQIIASGAPKMFTDPDMIARLYLDE